MVVAQCNLPTNFVSSPIRYRIRISAIIAYMVRWDCPARRARGKHDHGNIVVPGDNRWNYLCVVDDTDFIFFDSGSTGLVPHLTIGVGGTPDVGNAIGVDLWNSKKRYGITAPGLNKESLDCLLISSPVLLPFMFALAVICRSGVKSFDYHEIFLLSHPVLCSCFLSVLLGSRFCRCLIIALKLDFVRIFVRPSDHQFDTSFPILSHAPSKLY